LVRQYSIGISTEYLGYTLLSESMGLTPFSLIFSDDRRFRLFILRIGIEDRKLKTSGGTLVNG
jgi:hypothetical protein